MASYTGTGALTAPTEEVAYSSTGTVAAPSYSGTGTEAAPTYATTGMLGSAVAEPVSYETEDDGSLTGAGAYGYDASTYDAAPAAETTGYDAPVADSVGYTATEADATGYHSSSADAETYTPTSDALSADQLTSMLDEDSAYIALAENEGLLSSQSRGLTNSSFSAGASTAAAVAAAEPFALQDAATFADAGQAGVDAQNEANLFNTAEENAAASAFASAQNEANLFNADSASRASEFTAGAANTASLSNALAESSAAEFSLGWENQANQSATDAANEAAQYNAGAINDAASAYADAQNTADITNANNALSLALAEIGVDSVNTQIAADMLELGINSGAFYDEETATGFVNTLISFLPELGFSVVGDLADTTSSLVI